MSLKSHPKLEEIIRGAYEGISVKDLAIQIGISERHINRILKANGYDSKWYNRTKIKSQKEKQCERALNNLLTKGKSIKESSEMEKLGVTTFLSFLKEQVDKNNIPKPKCKLCGTEHDYSYGQGDFCGPECSINYSKSFIDDDAVKRRNDGLKKANEINKRIWEEFNKMREEDDVILPVYVNIYIKDINEKYGINNDEEYKTYEINERNYKKFLPDQTKEKISTSLKNKWKEDKVWAEEMRNKIREANKRNGISEKTKKKLSDKMREKVKNGTHKGWQVRGKNMQSYPERKWEEYFNSLGLIDGIHYFKEYKVNKRKDLYLDDSSNYFLDFLFINPDGTKIDIEIDGKQHQYQDRQESDKIRDKLLRDNGFTIYRIPWININKSEEKRLEVEKQKEDILNMFKTYNILKS